MGKGPPPGKWRPAVGGTEVRRDIQKGKNGNRWRSTKCEVMCFLSNHLQINDDGASSIDRHEMRQ